MKRDAVLSDCGLYRYRLTREWDETKNRVCFVMLNPSTADALVDDPTIRRCLGYATAWGFGCLDVVNVFGFRATDPAELRKASNPVGPGRDLHMVEAFTDAQLVVAAWGTKAGLLKQDAYVRWLADECEVDLHALKLTAAGHPSHPLYLRADLKPFPMMAPTKTLAAIREGA